MRTPDLYEAYPSLGIFYPFEFERQWQTTTKHFDFCASTMPHVILLCCCYVIFCFGGRYYMSKREPFDLKIPLALWNLSLSLFSFIGTLRTLPFLVHSIYTRGFYHSICGFSRDHYGHSAVGFWTVIFIFSKIPELFDTVFIVLRKKPLIFLHWYHHITVLMFCWHAFATTSSSGLYFVAMNFFVHSVMYFYYFLSSLGNRPSWGYIITVLQLSQMVIGLIICLLGAWYIYEDSAPCYAGASNVKWGILMYASYFALFVKFFIGRYILPKSKPKAKAN